MKPPYPSDAGRNFGDLPFGRPGEPSPDRIRSIGLRLFLVSLAMFFVASMIGYVIYRLNSPTAPPRGSIQLPVGLWVSTFILLGSTAMLHAAYRRSTPRGLTRLTLAAAVGTLGFIVIQIPCMLQIVRQHDVMASYGSGLYGLVMTLVLIHALHVVGGLIAMIVIAVGAFRRGGLDRAAVRHAAWYWHFLDAVWIGMFATFLITA